MTSETTSPAPVADTPGVLPEHWARPNSARDEWRRYLIFVKRPRVPDRASRISGAGLTATLRMLGLDLMVMLGLVLVAGAVLLIGFELPENELAGMELTPLLIFAIVVIAPLSEEIAFRGWLSGRPGHVLAILIGLAALLIVPIAAEAIVDSSQPVAAGETSPLLLVSTAGYLEALVLALLAVFLLRRKGPMRWFAWAFPLFFWLSTLGFALVHLFNYEAGPAAVLLPLVIPQLVVGSILGYVRVHYGLWASVLLHALHNGAAVGAVLLAMKLGA